MEKDDFANMYEEGVCTYIPFTFLAHVHIMLNILYPWLLREVQERKKTALLKNQRKTQKGNV